ncbi:MAG: glycoside hydrolase family 88 protein [Deltaproteobacteria bacterium]|nr:glycoside hydrolase family 88 protein [Deltaproteobacteria bacterium]
MYANKNPLAAVAICLLFMLEATGCGSNTDSSYFDACDEPISDEECYALRRDPTSNQIGLATDIALRYIDEHPAPLELWDWTSGVLMFALTELHRVTGDARIHDYYQAYLDHHIEEGYRIVWSDSCPPALTALALLAEMDDAEYQNVVVDVLDYLRDAPRTEEGGISHPPDFDMGRQLVHVRHGSQSPW